MNAPDLDGPTGIRLAIASLLIGGASGLRSQIGLAAVELGTPASRLPSPFGNYRAKNFSLFAAAGELVADKLPFVPDRTEPASIAVRASFGALASGLAARGTRRGVTMPAVVGALAALGATFGGLAARRALAERLTPLAAALIEDTVAGSIALAGLRVSVGASRLDST